jgi:hypothetical protein
VLCWFSVAACSPCLSCELYPLQYGNGSVVLLASNFSGLPVSGYSAGAIQMVCIVVSSSCISCLVIVSVIQAVVEAAYCKSIMNTRGRI